VNTYTDSCPLVHLLSTSLLHPCTVYNSQMCSHALTVPYLNCCISLLIDQSSVFIVSSSPCQSVVSHCYLLISSVIVTSSVSHWFVSCHWLSVFVVLSSVHHGLRWSSSVSHQSLLVFVHILIECYPYCRLLPVIFHGLCCLLLSSTIIVCGCLCLSMVVCGYPWLSVVVHRPSSVNHHLWSSIVCGHLSSMVIHRPLVCCLWSSVVCRPWSSVVIRRPSTIICGHPSVL
jgi:hypothetical protein